MGWWRAIGLIACGALGACHTRPHDATEGMAGGVTEGVLAPLVDLNVRRDEIPPILADLSVYGKPVPSTCAGIEIEIRDLEAYVGDDSDVMVAEEQASLTGRVLDMADDQAFSLISDLTTDFIPFRSVVRRATGASAHDRAVREAFRRGHLRRSYLKGVGLAMGCDSPAAPRVNVVRSSPEEAAADGVTFGVLNVPPAW